jgi:DNA polymerase-1
LGTNTGRFSSAHPNLQNISKLNKSPIRKAFKPAEGRCLVIGDYSIMEGRAAALFSQDPKMLSIFANKEDFHTKTASEALYNIPPEQVTKEQRNSAKPANFGLIFGAGAEGFRINARGYNVYWTLAEATDVRNKWFSYYSGLKDWHSTLWNNTDDGRTLIGRRRRRVKPGRWWNFQAHGNHAIQGSCADAVKLALCSIVEVLPPSAILVHTVHDEIAIECAELDAAAVRDLLQKCMEDSARTIFKGEFPAEVVIARSWGDK